MAEATENSRRSKALRTFFEEIINYTAEMRLKAATHSKTSFEDITDFLYKRVPPTFPESNWIQTSGADSTLEHVIGCILAHKVLPADIL